MTHKKSHIANFLILHISVPRPHLNIKKDTYSDGAVDHHGTDGEHQEGDGESHTSIF